MQFPTAYNMELTRYREALNYLPKRGMHLFMILVINFGLMLTMNNH
jgi:hypothetical protein